mmetsp:Transcript_29182/g.76584  ORF Transcript_29182/g.76584 Transcript_29182/m.76584 type:complete len:907 (-) Transcript_29182:59-2779(-)
MEMRTAAWRGWCQLLRAESMGRHCRTSGFFAWLLDAVSAAEAERHGLAAAARRVLVRRAFMARWARFRQARAEALCLLLRCQELYRRRLTWGSWGRWCLAAREAIRRRDCFDRCASAVRRSLRERSMGWWRRKTSARRLLRRVFLTAIACQAAAADAAAQPVEEVAFDVLEGAVRKWSDQVVAEVAARRERAAERAADVFWKMRRTAAAIAVWRQFQLTMACAHAMARRQGRKKVFVAWDTWAKWAAAAATATAAERVAVVTATLRCWRTSVIGARKLAEAVQQMLRGWRAESTSCRVSRPALHSRRRLLRASIRYLRGAVASGLRWRAAMSRGKWQRRAAAFAAWRRGAKANGESRRQRLLAVGWRARACRQAVIAVLAEAAARMRQRRAAAARLSVFRGGSALRRAATAWRVVAKTRSTRVQTIADVRERQRQSKALAVVSAFRELVAWRTDVLAAVSTAELATRQRQCAEHFREWKAVMAVSPVSAASGAVDAAVHKDSSETTLDTNGVRHTDSVMGGASSTLGPSGVTFRLSDGPLRARLEVGTTLSTKGTKGVRAGIENGVFSADNITGPSSRVGVSGLREGVWESTSTMATCVSLTCLRSADFDLQNGATPGPAVTSQAAAERRKDGVERERAIDASVRRSGGSVYSLQGGIRAIIRPLPSPEDSWIHSTSDVEAHEPIIGTGGPPAPQRALLTIQDRRPRVGGPDGSGSSCIEPDLPVGLPTNDRRHVSSLTRGVSLRGKENSSTLPSGAAGDVAASWERVRVSSRASWQLGVPGVGGPTVRVASSFAVDGIMGPASRSPLCCWPDSDVSPSQVPPRPVDLFLQVPLSNPRSNASLPGQRAGPASTVGRPSTPGPSVPAHSTRQVGRGVPGSAGHPIGAPKGGSGVRLIPSREEAWPGH